MLVALDLKKFAGTAIVSVTEFLKQTQF